MDLRKIKSKKGFTLIELMVVIVIIGILVAIALPNFIAAQDRAKVSSVKANMHTVQTVLETYAVDWGGIYANTTANLKTEATTKKYWKEFKNPFTGQGADTDILTDSSASGAVTLDGGAVATALNPGVVLYDPIDTDTTGTVSYTKYFIYGGSKEAKVAITDKNKAFYLTNS